MKINRWIGWLAGLLMLPWLLIAVQADSLGLSVSSTSVMLAPGKEAEIKVANASGKVKLSNSASKVAAASVKEETLKIKAKKPGTSVLTLKDKKNSVVVTVTVSASTDSESRTASVSGTAGDGLTISPTILHMLPDQKGLFSIAGASGKLSLRNSNDDVAEAELKKGTIKVEAKKLGSTLITVRDRRNTAVVQVIVQSDVATGDTGAGTSGDYTLLAWNDLGMHCMDGDFSVFSILPPYNNLHAQLVDRRSGKGVTDGVYLSYEAMADPDGSVNSISSTKTNFWQYVKSLFGVDLPPDVGLTGKMTATAVPQPMELDSTLRMFKAEGIPITPYDDAGHKNTYPLVKVVARNATGNVLAQARVVLPVSDEMSCASCHGSGAGPDAMPAVGWAYQGDMERDYKTNILRLHDEKQLGKPAYTNALQTMGFSPSGLMATVNQGRPILCASCHASNALPGTGVDGVQPLTQAIHAHHAMVKDAKTGALLDSINNRSACYQCHPGSETKCLRGAMGNALTADGKASMDCQSCHGGMSNVGRSGRVGWLDQPDCGSCHHDGKRDLSAVSSTGLLKKWLDKRYASNPDTPAAGFSLFRFSKGHGGMQCESCHGATHAEYPSSHRNDNLQSVDVQGREGSIGECASCHKSVPLTANGGPHGMHTVGNAWVDKHGDYAEKNQVACAYCHGADYRGGPLSAVKTARSFKAEGKTKSYSAGQKVGCYDCHDGPKGD